MRLNVENMKSWVCNLLKAILCGFNALIERVAGFIYKNARRDRHSSKSLVCGRYGGLYQV